jgi:hypothetical protein
VCGVTFRRRSPGTKAARAERAFFRARRNRIHEGHVRSLVVVEGERSPDPWNIHLPPPVDEASCSPRRQLPQPLERSTKMVAKLLPGTRSRPLAEVEVSELVAGLAAESIWASELRWHVPPGVDADPGQGSGRRRPRVRRSSDVTRRVKVRSSCASIPEANFQHRLPRQTSRYRGPIGCTGSECPPGSAQGGRRWRPRRFSSESAHRLEGGGPP